MAWTTRKSKAGLAIGEVKTTKRRPSRCAGKEEAPAQPVDQVVIWTLRLLLHTVQQTGNPGQVLARCDEALRLVGLDPVEFRDARKPETLRAVERALERATAQPPVRDEPFYRNIDRLGVLLELAPVERELLALAVKCGAVSALAEPFAILHPATRSRFVRALAAVLGEFDEREIKAALDHDGTLASSGLVRWATSNRFGVADAPLTSMEDLDTILSAEYPDDEALLAPFLRVTASADLTAADFPHLRRTSTSSAGSWVARGASSGRGSMCCCSASRGPARRSWPASWGRRSGNRSTRSMSPATTATRSTARAAWVRIFSASDS